MSIAVCLLVYSVGVAVLAPWLLIRVTRSGIAPRLGVAVWLAALGSVLGSWMAAAILLIAELAANGDRPGRIVSACVATLRSAAAGQSGTVVQIGLLTLTGLGVGAVVVLTVRLGRALLRARARTHEHARTARLAGRYLPGLDAVLLDVPDRLAYCVAGLPHTVVITRGALDALEEPALAAVLSHERAHLAGRHHLLLALTRGLAVLMPRLALFRVGAAEVARLLELCADDTAVRAHSPNTLVGALYALSGPGPVPAGALGMTGGAVLARAERLATPPPSARRIRARLHLTAAILVLMSGPVLTAALATQGIMLCLPMNG